MGYVETLMLSRRHQIWRLEIQCVLEGRLTLYFADRESTDCIPPIRSDHRGSFVPQRAIPNIDITASTVGKTP
jgi:hypothetical protein